MSTVVMLERMAEASLRFKDRIAGVFYLLTFVTGIFALMSVNLSPYNMLPASLEKER
jgi:hypothetical protein